MRILPIFKRHHGVTLIELLVVVGIMAVTSGMSMVGYTRFQENQSVRVAASQLATDLRQTQQKALSGEKPSGWCAGASDRLSSWRLRYNSSTTYQLIGVCSSGPTTTDKTVTLPNGATCSGAGCNTQSIDFSVLTGAADAAETFTVQRVFPGRTVSNSVQVNQVGAVLLTTASVPIPTPTSTPGIIATITPSRTPTPGAMATVTPTPTPTTPLAYQVAAAEDDANTCGWPVTGNTSVRVGSTGCVYDGGFRFTNVAIPAGAVITSAKLELFSTYKSSTAQLSLKVRADDVDSSVNFSTSSVGSRVRTAATSSDWVLGVVTNGAWMSSPDITSVVQEVIDRIGWRSGNSLTILVDDGDRKADGVYWNVETYDDVPSRAARLTVTYE